MNMNPILKARLEREHAEKEKLFNEKIDILFANENEAEALCVLHA